MEGVIRKSVSKITVSQNNLDIEIRTTDVHEHLQNTLDLIIPNRLKTSTYILSCPFTTRRAHKGTIIIEPENTEKDLLDLPPTQLKNLVRGVIWRDEHFAGKSLIAIAKRENLSEAGVRKIIMGSFDTLMSL